jgi:probable rRNA maturation factor
MSIHLSCVVQKPEPCLFDVPNDLWLENCIRSALVSLPKSAEITLCFVLEDESKELNRRYRNKAYPTNVLSFHLHEDPDHVVGDLVLCLPVIQKECIEYNQTLHMRIAHLVVHGVLHLQGYDHANEIDAQEMEGLETRIVIGLGFQDPWGGGEQ